jgi:nucleotide-binding universal stress UspA family protein
MESRGRSRVLVALDRTDDPAATVAALRSTQPTEQDLVLLEVLPPWCTSAVSDHARHRLDQVARRLTRAGTHVDTKVQLGETVEEIVAAARDQHVRLIAMVCHERPRLERWLLGSVSDDVVRQGPVPVLLLGAPEARCPSAHRGLRSLRTGKLSRLVSPIHFFGLAWR